MIDPKNGLCWILLLAASACVGGPTDPPPATPTAGESHEFFRGNHLARAEFYAFLEDEYAGTGILVVDQLGMRRSILPQDVEGPYPALGFLEVADDGSARLVRRDHAPIIDEKLYGWIISLEESTDPVRVVETVVGPPGFTIPGAHKVTIKGQTAWVLSRQEVPDGGLLSGFFSIDEDSDPPGFYELSVSLPDGTEHTYAFRLRTAGPQDRKSLCPYQAIHVDPLLDPDEPDDTQLSVNAAEALGTALILEGWWPQDLSEAYWQVEVVLRQSPNAQLYGYVAMRPFGDPLGKARRYGYSTLGEDMIDLGISILSTHAELAHTLLSSARTLSERLRPHATRLCRDWSAGRVEEERRLERIRELLTEEIEAIRRERDLQRQRKSLDLEVER